MTYTLHNRIRMGAAVLFFAMLLSLFAGCNGDFVSVFAPRRDPSLVLNDDPVQCPVVCDCDNADSVNASLREFFAPVAEQVVALNAIEPIAHMSYALVGAGDDIYTLSSYIIGNSGGIISLPTVDITRDGVVTFSADMPDMPWLSDFDFFQSYLALLDLGFSIQLERYGQSLSRSELYELCVALYEQLGGSVDLGRFTVDRGLSQNSLKALALGLGSVDELYDDGTAPQQSELLRIACVLLERLYVNIYGSGSHTVTLDELFGAAEFALGIYSPRLEDGQVDPRWQELSDVALAADQSGIVTENITRQHAAALFVRMYENAFGVRDVSLVSAVPVDIYNDVCRKAYGCGLMGAYPSSKIFSPDCTVWCHQLPSLVRDFSDAMLEGYILTSGDYAIDCSVGYREAVCALGQTILLLGDTSLPSQPVEVRINSRDYDWYFSQFGTGRFSSMNCMPSIAAMAVKWHTGEQSVVSVEAIRDCFEGDKSGGWYMAQVMDALDMYGVPYDVIDDIHGGIIAELDKGHIVLSQMSEAPIGESGHCFVIYGYRRLGDSVQFYIHDPGISDEDNIYGEPVGHAMLLDSEYVYWIIDRITFYFVSVGA